jgi:hypothetical protein
MVEDDQGSAPRASRRDGVKISQGVPAAVIGAIADTADRITGHHVAHAQSSRRHDGSMERAGSTETDIWITR